MIRVPPVRVVRAATSARTSLQAPTRRMVPPEVALFELVSGFMATHVVYAAARLGIADVLSGGPLTAGEVAAEVGASPDARNGCCGPAQPSASSGNGVTDASA